VAPHGSTSIRSALAQTFYYEHNQGGSGGWSASVTIKILSIGYTGSGGQRLQKSTPMNYYN
jgi:hypothetical protein